MTDTVINLHRSYFSEKERTLAEHGSLFAATFTFASGVRAVRLENELGHLVLLPYQGQQIWNAEFGGRCLTMRSPFTEPRPTQDYLSTYGGFLIHCGVTAMGVPSEEDSHPLHGELPNAPYQSARLLIGEDERGRYIGLQGRYQHTVAFQHNYLAQPLVKLYEGSTRFTCELVVQNLKNTEMELMYLAHTNFRPVDHGRIVYSALADKGSVRVRQSIPSHVIPKAGYTEFLDELSEHPERHHTLLPDMPFDPEVVFIIDYLADDQGWAHTLQVHPDGSADYLAHRPEQLRYGVRWISRTPDQDALGLTDPATAEPEGYFVERAKGNLITLPPKGSWRCDLQFAALEPDEAERRESQIASIIARAQKAEDAAFSTTE